MLGVPLMIMGAAKQAVAKKIDKRARGDLKKAMGNVAGAMGGGTGAPAFARKKYKSSTGPDRRISTAVKNAEKRRKAKRDAKEREEFDKMYSRSLQDNNPTKDDNAPVAGPAPARKTQKPVARIKSDLNVNEIDLSTNTTGGGDNSPNALEIGLKKAKEEREAAEESAMERKKDKGVKFTPKTGPNAGEQVIFRMKGMPPILREPTEKQKANLPPNLVKAIEDAPPMSRYNSETMEMENLKPLNRAALGMTGRNGDSMGISRMHSSFPKRSAAGKAKLMKTRYGQTGKAIPTNQLIKPIFKKAKGKE